MFGVGGEQVSEHRRSWRHVDWSRSSGHPVVAAADTNHLATRRRLSPGVRGLGREPPPRFRPFDRRGIGVHGMTLGRQGEENERQWPDPGRGPVATERAELERARKNNAVRRRERDFANVASWCVTEQP